MRNGSDPTLLNSIIWNNIPLDNQFDSYYQGDGNSYAISYSDIQNGQDWSMSNIQFVDLETDGVGEGILYDVDPVFVEGFSYALQSGSGCIDTGSPESSLDDDGTLPEIGALTFVHTFGCTDPEASNYNADASIDDDTCLYDYDAWYVDDEGDNEHNSGEEYDSPFGSIQWAVDLAENGDTIFVDEGTYYENVKVDKPLKIFSYYVIDSLQSQIDYTIINGSTPEDPDFSSVFYFNYDTRSLDSQLSGFTIESGLGTHLTETSNGEEFEQYVGGGVFAMNNLPTVKSNTFRNNGDCVPPEEQDHRTYEGGAISMYIGQGSQERD